MTKLTFSQMLNGLTDLSVEELHLLNKSLIQVSRTKQRGIRIVKAAAVVGKFLPGDVISFYKPGYGRNAGINYFIFDHMNRAGTGMQGPSCDENGKKTPIVCNWTVDVTSSTAKVHMRGGKKQ